MQRRAAMLTWRLRGRRTGIGNCVHCIHSGNCVGHHAGCAGACTDSAAAVGIGGGGGGWGVRQTTPSATVEEGHGGLTVTHRLRQGRVPKLLPRHLHLWQHHP